MDAGGRPARSQGTRGDADAIERELTRPWRITDPAHASRSTWLLAAYDAAGGARAGRGGAARRAPTSSRSTPTRGRSPRTAASRRPRRHGARARRKARRTRGSSCHAGVIDAALGDAARGPPLAEEGRAARERCCCPSESAELIATADEVRQRRRTRDEDTDSDRVAAMLAAGSACCPALARHGVEPHGRAAHHAGRRRQHHRRVRLRPGGERQQVARHRSRRLPLRGAGHRAEQVQLRRRTCSIAIHVATGNDVGGRAGDVHVSSSVSTTLFKNTKTILQSYLGVIQNVDDAAQNLTQFYTRHEGRSTGPATARSSGRASFRRTTRVTPRPSTTRMTTARTRPRMASPRSTSSIGTRSSRSPRSIAATSRSRASATMASTRDIQAIFDLLKLRSPGQGLPGRIQPAPDGAGDPASSELGGDQQIAGVYATTSRRRFTILARRPAKTADATATGSRWRGRATRCSTRASWRIEDKDLLQPDERRPVDKALFREVRARIPSSPSSSTCWCSSPTCPGSRRAAPTSPGSSSPT